MDALAQQRGLLLEKELNRIMEILIRDYQPEKLIVFGSAAQGEVRPWSDLDLVVVKKTEKPLLERIEEVLGLVRPKLGLDVRVYAREGVDAGVADRRGWGRWAMV